MTRSTSKSYVSLDDIAYEVNRMLNDYGQDAQKAVVETVEEVTKDTVKEVKKNATAQGWGSDYVKGWTSKIEYRGTLSVCEGVVYNKKTPGLVHLLELGHDIVYLNGNKNAGSARARAYEHVLPAQEHAADLMLDKIMNKLGI